MWPFSTIRKLKDELEYAQVRMAEDNIEFARLVREGNTLRDALESEKATSAALLLSLNNYKATAGTTIAELTAQLDAAMKNDARAKDGKYTKKAKE